MRRAAEIERFVVELPLRVTQADERRLLARLEAARQVYNAVLGESLKRLRLLRQSKAYQVASKLQRGPARTAAFRAAAAAVQFRENDLHHYTIQFNRSWLGMHLDSMTVQVLASRAFLAVQLFAVGKRGRPRFKGPGQIDSLHSKRNGQGIRWREPFLVWRGLRLPALIDRSDPVIAHGLASPIQFARLIRRKIRGRNRFVIQLMCVGKPYRKPQHQLGHGTVGIDPGPRVFGVAGADWGAQVDLALPLQARAQTLRRLQRQIDRQRRANNPERYAPDGQARPGRGRWGRSQNQRKVEARLAEHYRRAAAQRKSLHGQLVNTLLGLGDDLRIEKNGYRAFQRRFGRSVGLAAPSAFVSHLMRKAASAGAQVQLIPTTLRLSQRCHRCGSVQKKPLHQRVHACACGVTVQRDVYSAWLARFAVAMPGPRGPAWRLDTEQAQVAWSGAESRLPAVSSPISVPAFVAWARGQSASEGRLAAISPPPPGGRTE